MVKVLVVDDQGLVRAGFRMILEAQPDVEVVGEALLAPSITKRLIGEFARRPRPVPRRDPRLRDRPHPAGDALGGASAAF